MTAVVPIILYGDLYGDLYWHLCRDLYGYQSMYIILDLK